MAHRQPFAIFAIFAIFAPPLRALMPFSIRRIIRNTAFLPAILVVAALVVAALIHRFFMVPFAVQVGSDEGYEAAVVERMIDGQLLPYVDGVSHRGPFLYWLQSLAHLIAGRFEFAGTRLLGLASCLVTTAATFATGWAAGWPLAGAVGAAGYVFVVTTVYFPGGGIGVHGEPVAIAVLMTSFFVASFALYRTQSRRSRVLGLFLAGALLGAATFTKQTLAVALLPMGYLVLVQRFGDRGLPIESRGPVAILRGDLLPFFLGGLTLAALLLLRYAVVGELRSFFFWSTGFNARIYMEPYKGRILTLLRQWFLNEPLAIAGVSVAALVAIGRPLALMPPIGPQRVRRALGNAAFETALGIACLTVLFGCTYPLRPWPHYFVPIWPFFCLILGVCLELVFRGEGQIRRSVQFVAVAALGGVLIFSANDRIQLLQTQRRNGGWTNHRPDPACTELDRLAGPGRDPVFMWGLLGDLYITCQRRSASFFTYTTVVAGIVPPFWNEPTLARTAPGSRERLLSELSNRPPPVIFDQPGGPVGAMVDIPMFAAFLNKSYCQSGKVTDLRGRPITVYARKDLTVCPR